MRTGVDYKFSIRLETAGAFSNSHVTNHEKRVVSSVSALEIRVVV